MPTLAGPSIIDTMADPNLFSRWFQGGSWNNWRVFLKGVFGHRMTKQDLQTFHEFTSRGTVPKETKEVWVVAGRRAGKSLISALAAVYLACFRDYSVYLAPGERATVMVIAANRRQARVVMRYIVAFLENVPMLKELIERRTQESIDLANRVTIEVHTASFRSTRGYSIAAAVCDEIAFWRSEESANPDTEILGAIRPGMATIPGSMLFCISSPYARRGELWNAYRKYFGKEDRSVLVWQADSQSMNPNISGGFIQEAYERDPLGADAEYGAQFRRDVESFVSLEAVEAVTMPERLELPPTSHFNYAAFVDPSGSSQDSMTLAIAHREDQSTVLDAVREIRPPFSPEDATDELVSLLKRYGISRVTGDRFGGEWSRERFRQKGVEYRVGKKSKNDLYRDFLPLINSKQVELLDQPRLITQLVSLERRTSRGGRDNIDHPPGAHDDLVNAAAGALVLSKKSSGIFCF